MSTAEKEHLITGILPQGLGRIGNFPSIASYLRRTLQPNGTVKNIILITLFQSWRWFSRETFKKELSLNFRGAFRRRAPKSLDL